MTLVCRSREWNFLFYFFNLIATTKTTVVRRLLKPWFVIILPGGGELVSNGKFSIKMVFVNFEEKEKFTKMMNILIWRGSYALRETLGLFITTGPHKIALISKCYHVLSFSNTKQLGPWEVNYTFWCKRVWRQYLQWEEVQAVLQSSSLHPCIAVVLWRVQEPHL